MPRMFAFWDGGGTLWNSLPLLYESYALVFRDTIPQGTANRVGRELEYESAVCHRLRGLPRYSRAAQFGGALVACRFLRKAESDVERLIDGVLATPKSSQGLAIDLGIDDPTFASWRTSFVKGILAYQSERDPERYPLRLGAESIAKRMSDADIAFALVSNRDVASTRRILLHNNLEVWSESPDHFVTLECAQKEAPEAASALISVVERAGVSSRRVVWIGDSVTDIVAASNIGAVSIGLLGGMSPQADLERVGCKNFASNINNALEIILQLAMKDEELRHASL